MRAPVFCARLKLLGVSILIAHFLLSVAEAGVIVSKREIATGVLPAAERLNDPDIFGAASTKLTPVEDGQPKLENAKESESVPHENTNSSTNNSTSTGESDASKEQSLKLQTNRVEDEQQTEEIAKEVSSTTELSGATTANAFSHNATIGTESNEPKQVISGHVNNGLDELAAEQVEQKPITEGVSTTERMLPEVEQVALKPRTLSDEPTTENVATTMTPLKTERSTEELSPLHSNENQVETMTEDVKLQQLKSSTSTPTPASTSELKMDLTTIPPAAINKTSIARVDSIEGDSNEVRSSAEKRGKFINDNATNTQQMILPNAAEVWTLAGLKSVPHTTVGASKEQGNELLLESTERISNASGLYSNSEKNLLDWTQIMINGAGDEKHRFEKLMEGSTVPTVETAAPKDFKPMDSAEVTTPRLEKQDSDNQSEQKLIEAVVAETTPETIATAGIMESSNSSSTPLPPVVNEINVVDMATAGISQTQPSLQKTITPETLDTSTTHLASNNSSTTTAPLTWSTIASTLEDSALSADNTDKPKNVETATTMDTTTPESAPAAAISSNKTESEFAVATTTVKSSTQPAVGVSVTSTTAAPLQSTATSTPTEISAEPVPPLSVSSTTAAIPPAHLDETNNSNNEAVLDVSDSDSAATHNSSAAGGDASTASEHVSGVTSETTTLSTLAASEASTTSASVGLLNLTPNENRSASETTTKEAVKSDVVIEKTTLPSVLAEHSRPSTTTEVGQIGNEVESALSTTLSSSTIPSIHSSGHSETTATTTVSSSDAKLNELIINTTTAAITTTPITTTTSTTPTPIEEPVEASTVIPLQVATTTAKAESNTSALGSIGQESSTIVPIPTTTVAETTTTTESATAPVIISEDDRKANEVSNSASRETETSIETNAINQLEKTTTKHEITATTTTEAIEIITTPATVESDKKLTEGEEESETTPSPVGDNENTLLPETTMANILLNATTTIAGPTLNASTSTSTTSTTTTTEEPLINLLDDSTTSIKTTTTTTISSIATKIEEVYAVFSSSTTSTAPPTEATTTTTSAPLPPVTSTEVITSTAMIPPPPTLVASMDVTHLPGFTAGNMHPNSNDPNETDVNVIIAITVSVIGVVALILLVAFLYLIRKRQKQMSYGQRCRPVSLDAYSLDNVSVLGSVRRKGALRASKRSYGNIAFDDPSLRHNVLTAAELGKFVGQRSSIFEEFRDVPQIIARADEVPPGCEDKNRYANVIPLPETRVILQQQHDDDKTEYINANYVRGPKDTPNYYIATQAPIEITVPDFWRMIWEQQSRVIIQATDLIENGIEKCADYLPPSVTLDNHTTYGDFQVTLKNREVKDKYAISTLMLKNTVENACREITHYWYKWPETGVPSEEAPLIAMLLEARSSLKSYANESKEKSASLTRNTENGGENGNGVTVVSLEDEKKDNASGEINGNLSGDKLRGTTTTTAASTTTMRNQGPLTIHCSPGTGRTGTIIACDMAIRSLETPKRSVDIPQIVYYVRRGRASAVQTKEQYEFIYKVANMYATKITNLSNDN